MREDDKVYYFSEYEPGKSSTPNVSPYTLGGPPRKVHRVEYMPRYEIKPRPPGRVSFSQVELAHFALAWIVITAIFSFVFTIEYWVAAIPVTTGFFFHELSHKVAANKLRYWSEFRASWRGLGISGALAYFIGIPFAAPGAVLVAGNISLKHDGMVSLAGPACNIVVAICGLITLGFFESMLSELVIDILRFTTLINILLGAFNMLPIYPLDGSKIVAWQPPVFALTLLVFIFLGLTFQTLVNT